LIDPGQFLPLLQSDSPSDFQRVLPLLVMQQTPLFAQVIFFGAVLSAIMSCSSATLLAPSVTFAENIVRGFYPNMTDHQFLRVMRFTIVCFTGIVLVFALNTNTSIFKMVENAYKITLAGAFVPLIAGAMWRRSTTQGALAATFGGLLSWLLVEFMIGAESLVPPQLIGLGVSVIGMVAGSLLPQRVGHGPPQHDLHAVLHHHAAAGTHHVTERPHHHGQPTQLP
jgi:SSS family solute:Na+ symporter